MRRIALATAVVAGSALSGCMTVPPAAGPALTAAGYTYSAGRASQDYTYPLPPLQTAVTGAMEDLRIHSVTVSHEGGGIIYHGWTSDDRRVQVAIRPNAGVARVSVRIGWFGDPPLSRALMDRVGIRLGTLPPEAVPIEIPSAPQGNPWISRDAISDEQMLRDQADAIYKDSPVP